MDIHGLVVSDPCANRIGQIDITGSIGEIQTGYTEHGFWIEYQRINKVVIDTPINYVDASQSARGAHITDIVLNQQVGTSPTIDNAGTARIKGFELEAIVAPVSGLTVNASVGYLDATFSTLSASVSQPAVAGPIPGLREGAVVGGQLPKTAKWSLNLSPRYEVDLPSGASVVLLADWSHKSAVCNDVARYLPLRRPAIDLINASVSYREPQGHWDVTVGATNLTDKRYLVSGGANDAAGVYFGSYSRPREWYARFGFKF